MLEYLNKKHRKQSQEKEDGDHETAAGSGKDSKIKRKPLPETGKESDDGSTSVVHEDVADVPVLDRDEQSFLENLTLHWGNEENDGEDEYDDDGERPPLPPRMKTPDLTWDSDSESFVSGERGEQLVAVDSDMDKKTRGSKVKVKDKDAGSSVARRLSTLFSKKHKGDKSSHPGHLAVPGKADIDAASQSETPADTQLVVSGAEEARERDELARVLDDFLVLGKDADGNDTSKSHSKNKKSEKDTKNKFAATFSAESRELVRRFVVVLKDLVNGVPTAGNDLKSLLDDRDGALSRGFERLPSSMRKLVAQLPSKLTSSIAPELLAVAAESQGIKYEAEAEGVSAKSAAKTMLLPLLTKPNAIVKMLKAIMNALKLRWPAFIGTSAIWSVALFLLLFVLWYCHKRGREVRLEKEASDAAGAAGTAEGLPEDEPSIVIRTPSPEETGPYPHPPIGADAPK